MSKELVKFKKSYEDFVKYNTELLVELSKSHTNLVLQISSGSCNFSGSPWVALDNKTLAEFKALAIYDKIGKKLIPIMYPGVNVEPGKLTVIPIEKLLSPRKLNPQQLSEALDSIKEIAEEALQETVNNRTGAEIILNFLKSCVNFLITIVTFGQKQNFFKSSTFQLEKINQVQQDFHNIFDTLSEEDRIVELDRPSVNLGNCVFRRT
ncbi:hypothetical protein [uncultured Legionella sp.]|uniref:hypothetical protein n=1 Tax=uncultured Legionella sp. TaxID=210934 RepID=UPI002623838E|nr:hypothetical protein [uncultured Legionella sp.]